ncbi:hypothetical protein BAUCODRAFT_39751 [Baudoinia panamericana UAMH 10762]|uniref:Uncharacterized protein n=1 Tax=Baudoinia panamericana (strain UAMH 10762) TaxID=717646 RepID=M2LAW2_BAUPA|nr:uncharacterized protein BAUCODRAFT_39751 [Baudoinia panamericana UAMH 10762]EMC90952.1 hypothetical protein BAUCODRAFT_39751 [Baudoinia panamericana UAMH 10762]
MMDATKLCAAFLARSMSFTTDFVHGARYGARPPTKSHNEEEQVGKVDAVEVYKREANYIDKTDNVSTAGEVGEVGKTCERGEGSKKSDNSEHSENSVNSGKSETGETSETSEDSDKCSIFAAPIYRRGGLTDQ